MGEGVFGCAINPASYRERVWGVDTISAAASPSKVTVIGGGPGGMEAARVAALKGHEVTLFEARESLGGALALWAKLPGREFYENAVDWWERELDRLGVRVRLGTPATAETVLALVPDAVILATGAEFCRAGRSAHLDRPIPGADKPHVHLPEDILQGGARPTGKVVLLDGEGTHASSGIAEMLAQHGAQVIMISANFSPYSQRIYDSFEADFVVRRLHEAGVTFLASTWVREIGTREVHVIELVGERQSVIADVDAVVLVTGRLPVDGLAAKLEGKVRQLFTIGDALSVRPLATAAYEGQKFARLIGERDAPKSVGEAYFRADDPSVYPTPADR
jgi:NADPH-dependent 2,4-dienoyl-CoA reductase/sulfur reductase-like enzyme